MNIDECLLNLTSDFREDVHFAPEDFLDAAALAEDLREQSTAVARFLWARLSDRAKEALISSRPGSARSVCTMVGALNEAITDASPWEDLSALAPIRLRKLTRLLHSQNPSGQRLTWLKRRLLEDAWSTQIKRRCRFGMKGGPFSIWVQTDGIEHIRHAFNRLIRRKAWDPSSIIQQALADIQKEVKLGKLLANDLPSAASNSPVQKGAHGPPKKPITIAIAFHQRVRCNFAAECRPNGTHVKNQGKVAIHMEESATTSEPGAAQGKAYAYAKVDAAVARLSRLERRILELSFRKKFSPRAIAVRLGWGHTTQAAHRVVVIRCRVLMKLRRTLPPEVRDQIG